MRSTRTNIAIFSTILTSCLFIYYCKSGEKENDSIRITLDQLITDTVPFIPEFMFVRYTDQTQINFEGLDSIKIGVLNIQPPELEGRKQKEQKSKKNRILILKGFKEGKQYVFLDTDNDGNLRNERPYKLDEVGFVRVNNVDYAIGDSVYTTSFYFQPFLNTFVRENLGVRTIPIERSGIFQTHVGDNYRLALFNHFDREYTPKNSFLAIIPVQNKFNSEQVKYRVGDTIYLNRKVYLFNNVSKSGNIIEFKHLEDLEKSFGIEVGDYAFKMTSRDILSGKPYQISNSNKYTLIDFWGTWCAPCTELTGELKKIDAKFSDKEFEMVSIAFEDSLDKVQSYIKKNQIEWINLFDDSQNSMICSKFKVNNFPTFILLDKNGRIIDRGVGKEALLKIESDLQKALVK